MSDPFKPMKPPAAQGNFRRTTLNDQAVRISTENDSERAVDCPDVYGTHFGIRGADRRASERRRNERRQGAPKNG